MITIVRYYKTTDNNRSNTMTFDVNVKSMNNYLYYNHSTKLNKENLSILNKIIFIYSKNSITDYSEVLHIINE